MIRCPVIPFMGTHWFQSHGIEHIYIMFVVSSLIAASFVAISAVSSARTVSVTFTAVNKEYSLYQDCFFGPKKSAFVPSCLNKMKREQSYLFFCCDMHRQQSNYRRLVDRQQKSDIQDFLPTKVGYPVNLISRTPITTVVISHWFE